MLINRLDARRIGTSLATDPTRDERSLRQPPAAGMADDAWLRWKAAGHQPFEAQLAATLVFLSNLSILVTGGSTHAHCHRDRSQAEPWGLAR
jgi:hypothetical protein